MYPRLVIDMKKVRYNINYINVMCQDYGVMMTAVVLKDFEGDREILRATVDSGIRAIGDSRLENIK